MTTLEYLLCFSVFVILQSLAINGLKECFNEGHIFYGAKQWMDKNIKAEWLKKEIYKCVRCMALIYGSISFWIFAIWLFGFNSIEVIVWVGDIFILVYLNFFFYKRQ